MAIIFFRIFTENNPARGPEKYNIPDMNWLKMYMYCPRLGQFDGTK